MDSDKYGPAGDAADAPDSQEAPAASTNLGRRRTGGRIGSPRILLPRQILRPSGAGRFTATAQADEPRGEAAHVWWGLRRWLFGRPIASSDEMQERLSKKLALAVFASDALSSTAYATEEILLVLVLAGTGYLTASIPIALAITALLLTVILSYRQTIHAYPNGGGAYSVSSENLGPRAGLIAAAALLSDYVLTVAVSISAGTVAVIAALPELAPFRVEIALVALAGVCIANLRGVRESGTLFAVPTYLFVALFSLLIVVGLARYLTGNLTSLQHASEVPPGTIESFGLFLVLRAFSSGATALTGVEAIANGVTAFRPPEAANASITMAWMGALLASFFVGATVLASLLGVVPVEGDSVISQMARGVFDGVPVVYYLFQAATALILILAANTAFNDFPRLSAILARDRYMPRRFSARGDRLTFSLGIVALTSIAGLVLLLFRADTHRLIPLYAIGVFLAFTMSQAGMVVHWQRLGQGRVARWFNGLGAVATGIVAIVVTFTKFTHGAWVILLLVPAMVWLLGSIHRHYVNVDALLEVDERTRRRPRPAALSAQHLVVPARELNWVTWQALEYARRFSSNVVGVHVAREGEAQTTDFRARWAALVPDVPLVVVESPFRTFIGPFLAYVDSLAGSSESTVTVVVPEFRPPRWYQQFLHNRTGRRIQEAAEERPWLAVTGLPVGIPGPAEASRV